MKKVLISSFPQNMLVLAKNLETLKPDRVFLWDTTYAEKRNLVSKAKRTLEIYTTAYNLSSKNWNITISDVLRNPEILKNLIIKYTQNIPEEKEIYLDCTSGRGLNAAYLYAIALNLENQRVKISYCDLDSNSLILLAVDRGLTIERKSTHLEAVLSPLKNRFLINNVSIVNDDYKTIFDQDIKDKVRDNSGLEKLFNLMNNNLFRQFLSSYNELLIRWIKENILPSKTPLSSFNEIFSQTIRNVINSIEEVHISDKTSERIIALIAENFKTAVNLNDLTLKQTIEKLHNNEIEGAIKSISKNLSYKIKSWLKQENPEKNRICSNASRNIFSQLRLRFINEINLQNLLINADIVRDEFPVEYHNGFLKSFCEEIKEPKILPLLKSKAISRLFEDIVNYKLKKEINSINEMKELTHGIYANIKLSQNDKDKSNDLEIDSLLLRNNGNVLNFEVKQHHSNVKIKDLDARVENSKKIIGAYTKFFLIFPIFREDIECEDDNNKVLLNLNDWKHKFQLLKDKKNEFKVIYFDEITDTLIREFRIAAKDNKKREQNVVNYHKNTNQSEREKLIKLGIISPQ